MLVESKHIKDVAKDASNGHEEDQNGADLDKHDAGMWHDRLKNVDQTIRVWPQIRLWILAQGSISGWISEIHYLQRKDGSRMDNSEK